MALSTGSFPCACRAPHAPRFIVLTGGPGAGKTAVLEILRRSVCAHVALLPESASIVFGGGFPRIGSDAARFAAQRAIYHVQRELEHVTLAERHAVLAICDRGTLDALAYWPGSPAGFFRDVHSTEAEELARYAMVVHLRTPDDHLYDRSNVLRIETAIEARAIDARIERAWARHPRRQIVNSAEDFVEKARRVVEIVRAELPPCCTTEMRVEGSAPEARFS